MTIRSATPADAARLLVIYTWYVEQTAVSFEGSPPSLAEFTRRMERTMCKYPWLVAVEGEQLIGFAYAGPLNSRSAYDWSCETTVYMDRSARRCGGGRALYEALESALGQMGVTNLYACIAATEREDEYLTGDSLRFHARMGFTDCGRFHCCGYKFGRWYDVVWMEKIIGEHCCSRPSVNPWRG